MTNVAVVGLGRMGRAMAIELVRAGHLVTGVEPLESFAEAAQSGLLGDLGDAGSISFARTPADGVREADVVITSIADGGALNAVIAGPNGISHGIRSGALVCDTSTVGVDAAVAAAQAIRDAGGRYVDGPVSGSIATIRDHTLTVMASGADEDVAIASSVLGAFSKRVIHVGPVGSGQAMKLVVNGVVHALNAALSETLVMAEAGGVSRDIAWDVIRDSAVAAPYVQYKTRHFLDPEGTTPVFTMDLMAKDLALIDAYARSLSVDTPQISAARVTTDEAVGAGLGSRDMAYLAQFMRERSGGSLSDRKAHK